MHLLREDKRAERDSRLNRQPSLMRIGKRNSQLAICRLRPMILQAAAFQPCLAAVIAMRSALLSALWIIQESLITCSTNPPSQVCSLACSYCPAIPFLSATWSTDCIKPLSTGSFSTAARNTSSRTNCEGSDGNRCWPKTRCCWWWYGAKDVWGWAAE